MKGGSNMKHPLTHHWCTNEDCGWIGLNHKRPDAFKCPECKGFTISRDVSKKKKETIDTLRKIIEKQNQNEKTGK